MKTLQLAAVTMVLLTGGTAQANFLTNSSFDTNLSGWDYEQYPSGLGGGASWTVDNGGSAYIRGNATTENGYLRQANVSHPFASGANYRVSVDLASYGGGGQPNVELVLYDTTASQPAATLVVPTASITGTLTPFSFNYAVEPARVGNNWRLDINSTAWGGYTGVDNASVIQNLISNGDFNTDLSGWDYEQYPSGLGGGASWASDNGGSAYIRGSATTENGYLRQANATHPFAAGETYTISVDLAAYGGGGQPDVTLVLFDTTAGQAVASLVVPTAAITGTLSPFTFDYVVEAGRVGNNWRLDINSAVWGGYTGIDDVWVSAVAAAVPEPSSVALIGTALIGLVACRRNKRTR